MKTLLIWIVCQLAGIVASIWMLAATLAGSPRAWRIALAFDQLANAAFGGAEDETISSRCWRYRVLPRYAVFVRLINWLADDPDHCRNAFEATREHP